MNEDKTNASGEYDVPGSINSVEDTRPYVRRCIEAMLDDRNYSAPLNGMKGALNLTDAADKTLMEVGFGKDAIRWMHHPFHWLFNNLKIAKFKSFPNPLEGVNGVWVLDKEKTDSGTVDSLTDRFMKEYGGVFYARIERIRTDPGYCKS